VTSKHPSRVLNCNVIPSRHCEPGLRGARARGGKRLNAASVNLADSVALVPPVSGTRRAETTEEDVITQGVGRPARFSSTPGRCGPWASSLLKRFVGIPPFAQQEPACLPNSARAEASA